MVSKDNTWQINSSGVFIAEGGQKCLTDKREGLRDCFNKSMKNIIPNDFSLENLLPLLKIGETECKGCATLQHCLVKELETCKDKTTANLMETLFKLICKTLACSTERQAFAVGDGGPQQHLSNYIRDKRQQSHIADEILDANAEAVRSLSEKLKTKCERNSLIPNLFDSANISMYNFLYQVRPVIEQTHTSCEVQKASIQRSLDLFIVELKRCLTDKEEFFPKFLRDAFDSAFNYICEKKGWRLRHFRTSTGLQCFTDNKINPLRLCFNSIEANKIVDGEVILNKETMCKSFKSADECMTKHLKGGCNNNDNTFTTMIHGSLQEMQAPCSASSLFLSNALLSALILFYFRKLWY